MNLERVIPPHDPEFGSRRPLLLSAELGEEPEDYLRLVANPFLGFTYLVLLLILLFHSIFGKFAGPLSPMLLLMSLIGLVLVPAFMHFHCLDCGRTGPLRRWRKHICRRALERREAGKRRRIRGPTPIVQVVLWIWGFLALIVTLNSLNFFEH